MNSENKKNTVKTRTFTNDFESIRNAIDKIYIYGCFNNISDNNKQSSNTKKMIHRLNFMFSDEDHRVRSEGRKKIHHFYYDRYLTSGNYLVNAYKIFTFSKEQFFLHFKILSLLKQSDMTVRDIIDSGGIDCEPLTVKKEISELIENQFIVKKSIGSNANKLSENDELGLADDILKDLSVDDIKNLYDAIHFFTGRSLYSVPGHYAMQTIERYLKWERGERFDKTERDFILFEYNFISRILNDDVIYTLLRAENDEIYVNIIYNNPSGEQNKKAIYPMYFVQEFMHGREYAVALEKETGKINIFRCDLIEIEKKQECHTAQINDEIREKARQFLEHSWCAAVKNDERACEVEIEFNYDEKKEKYILSTVKKESEYRGGVVTKIGKGKCVLTMYSSDYMELIPWIRRFAEKAVVKNPPELRENIQNSWQSLLKKYEK